MSCLMCLGHGYDAFQDVVGGVYCDSLESTRRAAESWPVCSAPHVAVNDATKGYNFDRREGKALEPRAASSYTCCELAVDAYYLVRCSDLVGREGKAQEPLWLIAFG